MNDELKHYGVLGMKWGVRRNRAPATITSKGKVSSTTKKVINDYNKMSEDEFRGKYKTTKKVYAKRVKKYGDPYMNAPLAKLGKRLEAKSKKRPIESMSNEELQSRNKRLQLESQYKQLSQSSMSPGKKFVTGFVKGTGKTTQVAVQTAIAGAAVGAGKEFIKSRIKKAS